MHNDLQSLTYAQLRELHYICAGRRSFGFNPALNPATAQFKPGMVKRKHAIVWGANVALAEKLYS